MQTAGIITVATGKRHYLSLATDLALSVRRHTTYPITLAIEPDWQDFRQRPEARLFDRIVDLPRDALRRNLSKLYSAELSPYDLTIYLDADTLLTGPIRNAFGRLMQSKSGYVLQGEYLQPDTSVVHNNFDTTKLCQSFHLSRYLKSNSGIMGFEKQAGVRVQAKVRQFAQSNPQLRPVAIIPWLSDEICFGACADNLGIDIFEPEQPMYWSMRDLNLQAPDKIVHAILPDGLSLQWLLQYVGDLRKEAQVPELPGKVAWLRKILGYRAIPYLPRLAGSFFVQLLQC